jgi:predicted permease
MGHRLIGALMRLYPQDFRARFGAGVTFALEEEHRAARRRGIGPLVAFWITTAWNTLREGLRERLFRAPVGTSRRGLEINGRWERGVGEMITQTIRDLGLALRRMSKRPAFAVAGIVTLGLGIGATTAVFSVLNTVILRPLPYGQSDRLVLVGHRSDQSTLGIPNGGYLEYQNRSGTLADLAIYTEATATFPINDEPYELGLIRTTPNLFELLRVSAARGRTFVPEDVVEGAESVTVISHGFWQRMYGGDPDVIGKPVIEGSQTLVVGVMPEDFDFIRPEASVVFGNAFEAPDLFFPIAIRESEARFGNFMYQGIARLAPGATLEEARTELYRLMRDATEHYTYGGGHTRQSLDEGNYVPRVETLKDAVVGDVARVLWILMGTLSLVLLIAAANVANLFVLRAESLQKELAVRTALGASRRSLARWFLAEGLTLSVLGGVLGLAIASFGTRAVLRLAPGDLPRMDELGVDPVVLGFALGVSLIAGVLFGLVPVARSRNLDSVTLTMGANRTVTDGRSRGRTREALVVGQVAFALILLVGSGLLLRTFASLRSVDPGFGDSNVVTFKLALDGSQFDGELQRAQFMLNVADRVAELPGVTHTAFSADLPVDGNEWSDVIATPDAIPEPGALGDNTLRVFAGARYLSAIGAELVRGREFEALDFADYPRVAVVNQAFVEKRWPGEDPIGQQIAQWYDEQDPQGDVWYTVVGVVGDIRERSLVQEPEPTVYLPTVFLPESDFAMFVTNQTLLVQTAGPPHEIIGSVREEIRAIDSQILVDGVRTLAQLTAGSMQQVTFAMVLVIISAVVALALGIVGIYGAVAYTVGQRTREFGVRIALGATAGNIRSSVLRRGSTIGLTGIAIGLGGAALVTRVLQSLLFGVSVVDAPTYGVVAAGLLVLVLCAGLIPAQRATRVDPVRAMSAD